MDFEKLAFCFDFSVFCFKVFASGLLSLSEDSAAELLEGMKSASLPSSVDSSEKFMTASIRASLSFNSAVISSARMDSASVRGTAAASRESTKVASGVEVEPSGEVGSSGLAIAVAAVAGGIGLKIGERALLEGHVRLLCPVM